MTTDPSLYGICDGCGQVYLLTGSDHCAECGMHEWCCPHQKHTRTSTCTCRWCSNLGKPVLRCNCDTNDDAVREKAWKWSDCPKPGHEEGCFLVHCTVCDLYSSDCDEPWRKAA